MSKRVAIVGFGQTHHRSRRDDVNGVELINEAVQRALSDAQLTIKDIDAIVIGNMDHFEGINYVDMWSVDGAGGYLKPIFKLTTGGTTGTTVATGAYHHVASGLFDTVLAIGWEKNSESDTTGAIITCTNPIWERFIFSGAIPTLASRGTAYINTFGYTERDAARVAVRDRNHASKNPYAHLRTPLTIEDVLCSPYISYPIKLLDVCPRTDGAAAIVFAAEEKAKKMTDRAAWVWAMSVRHDQSYFSDVDFLHMNTLDVATKEVYRAVGIKEPLKELDVIEMYQPSSFAGLAWIEVMGLCGVGEAPRLLWDGVTDLGGELPVNPSGGVLNTNCIGATGLIRVGEVAHQIMGRAGQRQVQGAKIGMATGFGGCQWSDVMILGDRPR